MIDESCFDLTYGILDAMQIIGVDIINSEIGHRFIVQCLTCHGKIGCIRNNRTKEIVREAN